MEPPVMRTLGLRTNVLFVIAAAFGLLAALGRPWYAGAPAPPGADEGVAPVPSPVEDLAVRITREFTSEGGTDGWQAFTSTDGLLTGLVVLSVLAALGVLIPAIEQPCREILRLTTLAMLGIVVVKLVNTPDTAGLVERRQGAWVALGVTGIMASSASALYAAPLTRRKRGPSLNEYQPHLAVPPRSTVFDSGPPVPPADRA
jgi:hypothetical protein